AVVLILGLLSIEGGLNLMGSPYSFSNVLNSVGTSLSASASGESAAQTAQPDADGSLTIRVYDTAYAPNQIRAPAGKPLTLTLVTNGTTGCTRSFVIPALGVQRVLPESGSTQFQISTRAASGDLRFTCSMGMYSGQLPCG